MRRPSKYPRQLIKDLPHFMRAVDPYPEITSAEQPEFDQVYAELMRKTDNRWIKSADEESIARWEKLYDLTPRPDADLEQRRYTLLTYRNDSPPYTINALHRRLLALVGRGNYKIWLEPADYSILIEIGWAGRYQIEAVEELLRRIMPANLAWQVKMRYNMHWEVGQLTHKSLSEYTHRQIREEPLGIDRQPNTHGSLTSSTHGDLAARTHYEVTSETAKGSENLLRNSGPMRGGTSLVVWDIYEALVGLDEGTVITVSFDMSTGEALSGVYVSAYQESGASISDSKIFFNTETDLWERFRLTTQVHHYEGTSNPGAISFYDETGQCRVFVRRMKIELGSQATPWIPHELDRRV